MSADDDPFGSTAMWFMLALALGILLTLALV